MNRVEEIGGIHAVVFEDYRGRVPLLERKCGTPVNPSGKDLWVLCLDHDRAQTILRYGQAGINEYVTASRANTFEAQIAMLPPEAAVVFARTNGDDDGLMRALHPDVVAAGQNFIWRTGSYHLSAETAQAGHYMTRETRIGPSCADFPAFRAAVSKASARLRKRAPPPYNDRQGVRVVSAAAAALLRGLREPGVRALRHWLELGGKGKDGRWFSLSCSAFSPDTVEGVVAIHFEYGDPRITSRIVYRDGSVLNDLGLRLVQTLPDTVAHALIGLPADRAVSAAGLDGWPVREIDQNGSGTFLGIDIPSVPVDGLQSAASLAPEEATGLLAGLLTYDLRRHPVAGPLIRERDSNWPSLADEPCLLKGGADAMATLSALGAETAAFLLSQVLMDDRETSIGLEPWLGRGRLERRLDQIVVTGGEMVELALTSLMPGRVT
jgi:hypothetical protein